MKLSADKKKDILGWGTIAMSMIGIVISFFCKDLLFGTFTPGTWLAFIGFILSMGAVHDHGSNRLAASAFWITFLAMSITLFLGIK